MDSISAVTESECLVRLSEVSKTYRERDRKRNVLERVSLDIKRGCRLAFVGPNGSGKTTLLRILLGIERPDFGAVTYSSFWTGAKIAYVPQDYRNALFPWLRLRQNLHLRGENGDRIGQASGVRSNNFERFASAFHLTLDLAKYPYQLSGGEQQLFLITKALSDNPDVVCLDEPLSAVDFARKRLVHQHFTAWLASTPVTVLFASHDFEEATLLADKVVVFTRDSGEIKCEIDVPFSWPRSFRLRDSQDFVAIVDSIARVIL